MDLTTFQQSFSDDLGVNEGFKSSSSVPIELLTRVVYTHASSTTKVSEGDPFDVDISMVPVASGKYSFPGQQTVLPNFGEHVTRDLDPPQDLRSVED